MKTKNIIITVIMTLYVLSGIPLFIWLMSNDTRELLYILNPHEPFMPALIIVGVWSLVIIAFTAFYTSRIEEKKAKTTGEQP